MARVDRVLRCNDDGLYLPEIKPHSLRKIELHNRLADRFTSAMQKKWPQLAYIGLYAGAGRARVVWPTEHRVKEEIVETSSLAVLRQAHLFTRYIYVDSDARCTSALEQRIASLQHSSICVVINGDVNEAIETVRRALPRYGPGNGLLSLCFVDPFDLGIKFSTIAALAHLRMDFVILLMLGVDVRRNFRLYYADRISKRIGDCIDCTDWRELYDRARPRSPIQFVVGKFDEAMVRLGYRSAAGSHYAVKIEGMGVLQYFLAYYSKRAIGQKFWRDCMSEMDEQFGLGLV